VAVVPRKAIIVLIFGDKRIFFQIGFVGYIIQKL